MSESIQLFVARLRRKEPAPFWTVMTGLGLLLAYLVLRVAALALVSVLRDSGAAARGLLDPLTANLAAGLAALLTLAVLWQVLRRAGARDVGRALRLDRRPDSVLLLILLALGAAITVDFVQLLFQTISLPVALQGMNTAQPVLWLLAGANTVVLVPLAQTLVLQGVLYPALAARSSNVRAVLYTALLFMLMLAFDNPGSPVVWLEGLLTGAFLTTVRAHQQSTRAALIAALMFGAFTFYKAVRLTL